MIPILTLSLSGEQHAQLRNHLFPSDGNEAIAILLCARRAGDRRHRLLVREIFNMPYEECERTPSKVTWKTTFIEPILDKAEREGLSVIKVHSHPCGFPKFSETDNESDKILLPMIRGWVEHDVPHGSVVMLPDGQMFGRVFESEEFHPIEIINVVGDDLLFWYHDAGGKDVPSFAASHAQIFDDGTIERLKRLSVAVVGCSGTGSPLVEQLVRLGVGEIVLVDDDLVEDRNLNRILNSTMSDAEDKRLKVDVIGDAIERIGLGTRVIRLASNLWNADVVRSVAQCDLVFGCMDTVDGRFLLNALATYYTIGYFDVGVRLEANNSNENTGGVREVCGTVHYLQPGKSSLLTRDLFSLEQVAAAGLKRNDPEAFQQQLSDGYIAGAQGNRPAVISVNMFASSLAVNELLARLHPFREEPNSEFASVTFSLASMELLPEKDEGTCSVFGPCVGRGDVKPFLGQMELAETIK
jgi:proteasome lid subunit RPN8/RPN11